MPKSYAQYGLQQQNLTRLFTIALELPAVPPTSRLLMVPPPQPLLPPAPRPRLPEPGHPWFREFLPALLWPLNRAPDLWKLAFPAIALLFLPYIGILIARGWRVEVVRRMAYRQPDIMPHPGQAGTVLASGLILFLMTIAYTVPFILLAALLGLHPIQLIIDAVLALWKWLQGASFAHTFAELLATLGFKLLSGSMVTLCYFLTMWTVYRCAMIRYAVENRVGVFFELWTNLRIVEKNLPDFMFVIILWLLLNFVLGFLAGILAATGIGVLIIQPTVVLLSITTSAYFFGILATRIAATTI